MACSAAWNGSGKANNSNNQISLRMVHLLKSWVRIPQYPSASQGAQGKWCAKRIAYLDPSRQVGEVAVDRFAADDGGAHLPL